MRITIHFHDTLKHHSFWGNSFAEGLRSHGIEPQITIGYNPSDCDLAVFWGHHERARAIMEAQLSRGLHYLVMERGYFGDRFAWTSLGYDGHNGRADFCNTKSSGDRWRRHRRRMKAWNPGNEYILLIGQVPTDAAIAKINIEKWYDETVTWLKDITDIPIKFRPHPMTMQPVPIENPKATNRQLHRDIKNARCVVTFNSTFGVDSILAGIPVITVDQGSMVWSIASHDLADVTNPPMPERKQWAHDLAYCQWSKEEIESGIAWEHLKNGPGKKME